jgi:putative solute:sodium symporter small subunit
MADRDKRGSLSLFRPRGESMRREVRVIKLVLAGWLISIVGFQIFVYLLEVSHSELLLNELTIFNLPVHFWLTGHFLPLWFIILCALFNVWMDRHSMRSLDGSLRFTVRSSSDREGDQ